MHFNDNEKSDLNLSHLTLIISKFCVLPAEPLNLNHLALPHMNGRGK